MTFYHPDISMLADYSAGNLTFGPALCVTVHLEYCQHCHHELRSMTTLGAVLMEQQAEVDISPDLLDEVLLEIAREDLAPVLEAKESRRSVLEKFVPQKFDDLSWRGIGRTLKWHELDVGDPLNVVSLIRMRKGGATPVHTHKGQEITLVLQGGFSDASGCYNVGDFIECTPEIEHQPVASQNEDCICLTSRSAPLKFTGPIMRSINPFVKR